MTIADAGQKAWGFQLTARVAGNATTPAGSFASATSDTLVLCADATASINTELELDFGGPQNCPSNQPLAYIEHSLSGYRHLYGQSTGTYQFDWTPPATSVGNITIYVAGNAANGDDQVTGDHIYTATYTLTPAAGGGSPPTVTGVVNYPSGQPGVVPGSFVSIYGSNFAPAGFYDDLSKSIINGQLPMSLDGVTVSIGGKPAYIIAITAGQINVQAPDVGSGSVAITVGTSNGTSAPFSTTSQQFSPGILPLTSRYALVSRASDYKLIADPAAVAGSVAAQPGDVLILWCSGLGPVTPVVPAGTEPTTLATAVTAPTVTVGGVGVTVVYAALSQYAGLYQVAIQLPASMSGGDLPIVVNQPGAQSPSSVYINVAQ